MSAQPFDVWAVLRELAESVRDHAEAVSRHDTIADVYGDNSNRKPMREARAAAIRAARRLRIALDEADAAIALVQGPTP